MWTAGTLPLTLDLELGDLGVGGLLMRKTAVVGVLALLGPILVRHMHKAVPLRRALRVHMDLVIEVVPVVADLVGQAAAVLVDGREAVDGQVEADTDTVLDGRVAALDGLGRDVVQLAELVLLTPQAPRVQRRPGTLLQVIEGARVSHRL